MFTFLYVTWKHHLHVCGTYDREKLHILWDLERLLDTGQVSEIITFL